MKSQNELGWGGDVFAKLSAAIDTVGHPEFYVASLNLLSAACHCDSSGVMVYHRSRAPMHIVHRQSADRKIPKERYVEGPYVLDPIYQLFLSQTHSGIYWLQEVAPDDFHHSEYYNIFFSQTGVSDEMGLLLRTGPEHALAYFLERGNASPNFDAKDQACLSTLLATVLSLHVLHHNLSREPLGKFKETLTHQKVQSTIDNFGNSLLTPRERQVLFYMLSGYSASLTAQRLNITEGTTRIHRKNIHRKLEIRSQSELFSLFIRCIPYAAPDTHNDPLQAYQSKADTSSSRITLHLDTDS